MRSEVKGQIAEVKSLAVGLAACGMVSPLQSDL
jgi:hypothetical protein